MNLVTNAIDIGRRLKFCLHNKLFSDESYSWFSDYVNKQNCRYWNRHKPEVFQEASMNSQRLTVWYGLR